jgi:hypothetical protein
MNRFGKWLTVVAIWVLPPAAFGQGTAFTYQGQLKDGGSLATGNYELSFSLWDDPAAGSQVAGPVNHTAYPVAQGLFTVELDFGVAPYTANQARWLKTTVNGQALSPRQKLTPTPFALNTRGINVDSTGNVGIETTTPGAKFHVSGGPAWTSAFWAKSLAINNSSAIEFGYGAATKYGIGSSLNLLTFFSTSTEATAAAPNYFMSADSTGRVGIGTLAPAAKLHVAGGMKIDGPNTLEFGAGIPKETSAGKIGYQAFGSNDSLDIVGAGTLGSNRKINFWNEGGAYFTGSISTTILQIRGGADLAEPFDVSGNDIRPGMVVTIDAAHPGRLLPSANPYDRKVAGIISGAGGVATGLSMGHEGTIADGKHLVALSGRVYCMADGTTSAIEPGDMLTTSSLRGHAMRAADLEQARGAVIGKAMTALAQGERGLVLVLVNLQ